MKRDLLATARPAPGERYRLPHEPFSHPGSRIDFAWPPEPTADELRTIWLLPNQERLYGEEFRRRGYLTRLTPMMPLTSLSSFVTILP